MTFCALWIVSAGLPSRLLTTGRTSSGPSSTSRRHCTVHRPRHGRYSCDRSSADRSSADRSSADQSADRSSADRSSDVLAGTARATTDAARATPQQWSAAGRWPLRC
jgi:hypothetical protein